MQAVALTVVVGVGIWAYQDQLEIAERGIDPNLERLAMRRIRAAFTREITVGQVTVDLIDGVTVQDVRIADRGGLDTFTAARIIVQHDILALASGAYVPTHVRIDGVHVWAQETPDGVQLLFPIEPSEFDPGGNTPRIVVTGGSLNLRALPNSKRLKPGSVVTGAGLSVDVVPHANGRLRIEGSFEPADMGHDGVRVQVTGWYDPEGDHLKLGAIWKPVDINPALLSRLAPDIRERFAGQRVHKGTLHVSIERDARTGEGELVVIPHFEGKVVMTPDVELPEGVVVGFRTEAQLREIFDQAEIEVAVDRSGMINIRRLMKALSKQAAEQAENPLVESREPKLVAHGTVEEDLSRFNLTIEFRHLRFEDEEVAAALGEEGAQIYKQLDPKGLVNMTVRVERGADGEINWGGDVEIEDGSFRYLGSPAPDGTPRGFPYAIEQAMGRLNFEKGFLRIDEIVGFNGSAVLRILGHHQQAWTGGSTGRILLTPEGPDVRLTIIGEDVPVDERLRNAIQESEVAGLLELFQVEGKIDEIAIDIVKLPVEDVASAQVRVRFSDERFRYADFPVLLNKIKGEAQLRRTLLEDGERGRILRVDLQGEADGSPVSVKAEIVLHEEHGRLHLEATDVNLEGEVARTIQEAALTRDDLAPVWRFLAPTGRADVTADLPLDEDEGPLTIRVQLRGASIRLDAEEAEDPLVLEDIKGLLEVVDDRITLRGLEGRLDAIPVRVEGEIRGGVDGAWDIRIDTDVLRLDRDLIGKLTHYLGEPTLLPEGLRLETGARLAVGLRLRRKEGPDEKLEAEIETRNVKARLRLLEGTPLEVEGQRVSVADGVVTLEDVEGEAPGIRIRASRLVVGEGPLEGVLELDLEDFEVSDELLMLVPESARDLLHEWLDDQILTTKGLRIRTTDDGAIHVDGDVTVVAAEADRAAESARGTLGFRDLVIHSPGEDDIPELRGTILFRGFSPGLDLPIRQVDGRLEIKHLRLGDAPEGALDVHVDRAHFLDIQVRDLHVPVRWAQGILEAKPLRGSVAEGTLVGEAIVHTREPLAYEGKLELEDLSVRALQRDLAPEAKPYAGRLGGWIQFENRGGDAHDLVARGKVSVHEGDLGELPGVANIKALFASITRSRNPPKFERLHADFVLRHQMFTFQRLDLAGPIFDMPGSGTVDLNGQVDLDFRPHILKSLLLPGSMQIPGLGDLLGRVLNEGALYRVHLQGDLETAEPEVEALPGRPRLRPPSAPPPRSPRPPPKRRLPRWFR